MPRVNQPVIRIRGLARRFGEVRALDGLDLEVPENSIFGFLGPNGAGKSTAIKLLLGLLRPSDGKAEIFGLDVVRDSLDIRRRVGYLSQDPRFYPQMTARETLRFTARFFYQGPRQAIEQRVQEALELTGLSDKADRLVQGFSGGERQRLGIAQAQINHPELLILDEPAASLDPQGRHDVLSVMERLREDCTIFYSTHILADVQRVSDMVAIVDRGRLVTQAPTQQLLAGGDGNDVGVFRIGVRGSAAGIEELLAGQPWVSGCRVTQRNGETNLEVTASLTDDIETRLLRLLLDSGRCTVTEFGRKKLGLEEVFLGLVGGKNDVH